MTNNKTTALIESWKPMPEVLRGYAKDMDTNTRLIDGDIAPYLRKVADWIEALAAFEQPRYDSAALIDKIEGLKEQVYYVDGKPNIAPFADVVNDKLDAAIHIITAAFEQPAVREMTVEEVAHTLLENINEQIDFTKFYYGFAFKPNKHYAQSAAIGAAKALAKLGTIRVVEKDNG